MKVHVRVALTPEGDGASSWEYEILENVLTSYVRDEGPEKDGLPDIEGTLIRCAERLLRRLREADDSIREQIAVELPAIAFEQALRERGERSDER